MIRSSVFTSTLKFGTILGIGFCLYTTLMWLTKLDTTYLYIGQYLDMAIIILPIAVIFQAIRHENNISPVTFPERMIIAFYVGAISFLIYQPFLFVYHHYINPDWFNAVLELKQAQLRAANESPERIAVILKDMQTSNAARSGIFSWSVLIPSVFIVPGLIAIISLAFIRRKRSMA